MGNSYKIAICDDTEVDKNFIKSIVSDWAGKSGGETNLVPIYRIRFIDVCGNYTTVHADKEYTIKKTLSDVEKELDERFYRVGRSCIVNLTQISKVSKTDIFFNSGETVPLPRGSYEKVNRAIIQFT